MLPLIAAARDSHWLDPIVISTGQHAQMVSEVLSIDGIVPDVTFELPRERTLNELFAAVLQKIDAYLTDRFGAPLAPDAAPYAAGYPAACFVHGDTTSAAAGALAAFHRHLPVVHVEAGLRTSDTLSRFPEELNRQLISRIASLHLAPTAHNKANLVREGVAYDRIFVTGNTGIDALHLAVERSGDYDEPELEHLNEAPGAGLVLVTAHRRENWGAPMRRIADAVGILAQANPAVRFVVSMHPNPAVANVLTERLTGMANVALLKGMSYASFARLLSDADLVITDSGGIQEATSLVRQVSGQTSWTKTARERIDGPEVTEVGKAA